MPWQLHLEYEGAIYQLLGHGDPREDNFWDETDRASFLKILARSCAQSDWQMPCLTLNDFIW